VLLAALAALRRTDDDVLDVSDSVASAPLAIATCRQSPLCNESGGTASVPVTPPVDGSVAVCACAFAAMQIELVAAAGVA
jgi:hypothetical protein